eukprot:9486543-Pyramimonas_sp.AAC.1
MGVVPYRTIDELGCIPRFDSGRGNDNGYAGPTPLTEVRASSLPFRDWCPIRVYSLSPRAIVMDIMRKCGSV